MKIIKKIADNTRTLEGVTLAFLGDSVTQGCFELYKNASGGVSTVFDQQSSYEMTVLKILNTFFPTVPINIINAGASGGKAAKGLERVERDVIRHAPDLTVVCFALNDSGNGEKGLGAYVGRRQSEPGANYKEYVRYRL